MTPTFPARAARLRAHRPGSAKPGLSVAEAARLAGVTPGYLRECERTNHFSFLLAQKLAAAYGAPLLDFLPRRETTGPRTRVRGVGASGRVSRKE